MMLITRLILSERFEGAVAMEIAGVDVDSSQSSRCGSGCGQILAQL
jgi:hypothetical protein